MGSEVHLTAWTDDEPRALRAFERAFDEFDRLDRLHSVWKDGSDVSRVNAEAGQSPVRVSPETLDVLRVARQVSEWTGGKFDVTFGALSGLWKFDHDQDNQIPRAEDLRRQLPLIDFLAIDVDAGHGTVFLRRRGMRMHFGGIGKGYAVDRAAAILRAGGVTNFLIQSGGDLYAGGTRGDRPWRSGIRDPRGPADRVFAAMDLRDETSARRATTSVSSCERAAGTITFSIRTLVSRRAAVAASPLWRKRRCSPMHCRLGCSSSDLRRG
jgi:thiamine biosynthesis lipoprotein